MNRAFKTEFHNGIPEKPIITMSVRVNNGKRFKNLDDQGRSALYNLLWEFEKSVERFREEIGAGTYQTNEPNLERSDATEAP